MIQADRLWVLMSGPAQHMARIKCSVGKGGSGRESQKDAVFEPQEMEEHMLEWEQHEERREGPRQTEGRGGV